MKRSAVFLFLLCSYCLVSCDNSRNAPPPPPEVDVALPSKQNIVEWDEFTGRFQAIEEVDVRSRVTGYLDAIQFKDGQTVQKGDVLFIIDPRPFQYALERATAQYELTKKQYARAIQLKKSSFVSLEAIDQRFQEMKTAETHVAEAKLNLEFTHITSPISGKISHYFVSVGNLVHMDDTVLTRVVSFDPIHFYFEISQNDLLKYQRLDKKQQNNKTTPRSKEILIKLQDEQDFTHKGTIDFVDNIVDKGTGTILQRALVPNAKDFIYPGLFGRVRVQASGKYPALLIPDTAINTDQTRKYVYVVNKNNTVERVYVELGPLRDDGFYIIRSGLQGNEHIVVNGVQRIQAAQQKVTPHLIKLNEVNE